MEKSNIKRVYCHFSFKRPKGKQYGLFAVAFYSDFEGKRHILHKVRKFDLWQNHQFVTAIQSYEHALLTIYEYQGMMKEAGISQVMLVTDNSTLAGWIENPNKNKKYAEYMNRAVKPYRSGSFREIVVGVGLCEARKSEKSYKYCKEELVCNNYIPQEKKNESKSGYKIDIGQENYTSALDILDQDKSIPEITGMKQID